MSWGYDRIDELTAVADSVEFPNLLDEYTGDNSTGQTWDCYKVSINENGKKSLHDKLVHLLKP